MNLTELVTVADDLQRAMNTGKIKLRDSEFIASLIAQHNDKGYLSGKQEMWLRKLHEEYGLDTGRPIGDVAVRDFGDFVHYVWVPEGGLWPHGYKRGETARLERDRVQTSARERDPRTFAHPHREPWKRPPSQKAIEGKRRRKARQRGKRAVRSVVAFAQAVLMTRNDVMAATPRED